MTNYSQSDYSDLNSITVYGKASHRGGGGEDKMFRIVNKQEEKQHDDLVTLAPNLLLEPTFSK